jgi:hypothetical protein
MDLPNRGQRRRIEIRIKKMDLLARGTGEEIRA